MVFTLCGVVLISQTRRWHLCTANVLTAMCIGAALIESSRLNIMMMLIILMKLGGRYVGETPAPGEIGRGLEGRHDKDTLNASINVSNNKIYNKNLNYMAV